tara:strand:+ start:456 stop:1319 length:864 start_codon:yes stop_codon:yes gene_type:complete
MAIGYDRYNRMSGSSTAAGQGGSSANMPVFAKATPGVTSRPGSGGFFDAIGGVAENIYANNLSDQNVADNQAIFDQQIAAGEAGNITGGDVETYYDPVTKTIKQKFSDRREGLLGGLYSGVSSMGDQIGKMNPYEYADYMYNEASGARNLAQDREKAQVLEMMNARGIDTSTIGGNLFGQTVQNQNFANSAERAGYIAQGQNMENQKVANYNAMINSIYGNDAVNSQGVADAVSLGFNVTPPAGLSTAYNNQMDTKAQGGGALGDILGIAGNAIFPGVGGIISGLFS